MWGSEKYGRILEGLNRSRSVSEGSLVLDTKVYKTENGLEFKVTEKNTFKSYDKKVADAMLSNYGVILLGAENGDPLDNEADQEEALDFLYGKGLLEESTDISDIDTRPTLVAAEEEEEEGLSCISCGSHNLLWSGLETTCSDCGFSWVEEEPELELEEGALYRTVDPSFSFRVEKLLGEGRVLLMDQEQGLFLESDLRDVARLYPVKE